MNSDKYDKAFCKRHGFGVKKSISWRIREYLILKLAKDDPVLINLNLSWPPGYDSYGSIARFDSYPVIKHNCVMTTRQDHGLPVITATRDIKEIPVCNEPYNDCCGAM